MCINPLLKPNQHKSNRKLVHIHTWLSLKLLRHRWPSVRPEDKLVEQCVEHKQTNRGDGIHSERPALTQPVKQETCQQTAYPFA